VGPHLSRQEDLIWTGTLKVFTIRFSTIGFRAIFGISAESIRNLAISADLVIGKAAFNLEDSLAEAGDDEMPPIAERFLLRMLHRRSAFTNPVVVLRMTEMIKGYRSASSIKAVASMHNVGVRQMERLFQEFVGVSPKQFARLDRVQRALTLSRKSPQADWSAIAAASGYFDQSHFIREFRALNGTTPVAFAQLAHHANEFRSRHS